MSPDVIIGLIVTLEVGWAPRELETLLLALDLAVGVEVEVDNWRR
jgi:hypothetical protein